MLVAGCHVENDDNDTYSYPAEWESHDAVWISFFGGPTDLPVYEIARSIAQYTPIKCVVPRYDYTNNVSHQLAYEVRARLTALGVDRDRLSVITTDSLVQTRDKGPIFVKNAAGKLKIVDFKWNNYGDHDTSLGPDSYPFDSLMAAKLQIPTLRSDLVMEGGAMEVNGQGTLLQVEAVTLQRNPGRSREAIEEELKTVLGQKKVIWLKEGPAEDPHGLTLITENYLGSGVGGHVDEFARFVNANTILLAFPDSTEAANNPVKRITYERMKVNYDLLRQATDQDGNPFEIIKVPVPDAPYLSLTADTTHPFVQTISKENPQIQHGDTLYWVPASSYLNFFVTNNMVLVPAYWQAGLPLSIKEEDEQFQAIMATYFPERAIIPINALALNDTAGGIHCWTQQQPASP